MESFKFEQTNVLEEKKKSFLESMYKSKVTRVLALATALFGGGVLESNREKTEDERIHIIATEVLHKEGVRLEDLADKFRPEVQVAGGEKTILHIGQTHIREGLAESQKNKERIINSQKHVEELLSYLVEKGLSDTVFLEGIRAEDKAMEEGIKDLISSDNRIGALMNLAISIEQADAPEPAQQQSKAFFLYLLKCDLDKEFKKRSQEHTSPPEVLTNIQKIENQLGNNDLIKGDNIYLWGAAEKMYAEGRIKIEATETQIARDKTEAPYSWSEKLLVPVLGPRFEQRHRIREDAALDLVEGKIPSEKVIPLIYGAGHDFTDSVTMINEKPDMKKLGLVKVIAEETNNQK